MYEKAEEDAIETQLKERATTFAQELVKVSASRHEKEDLVTWWILKIFDSFTSGIFVEKAIKKRMGYHQYA